MRTLRDLDAAALRLREACLILLDETQAEGDLRAEVFAQIPRDQLAAATARVGELARQADDRGYYAGLLLRELPSQPSPAFVEDTRRALDEALEPTAVRLPHGDIREPYSPPFARPRRTARSAACVRSRTPVLASTLEM